MKLLLRASHMLSVALLLMACSAAERLPADLQMPVWLETAQNYEPVCPIINSEQAARAALRLAQKDGALVRAGAQRVVDVRRTTYADGYHVIYGDSHSAAMNEAAEAAIWLVTLDGLWQIAPPGARASYTARPNRVKVALMAEGGCGLTLGFQAKEIVVAPD